MDNENKNSWSSKLLGKLGVKQAVFETKTSSRASQFAMATALSLCMGAGAAMANDQQAGLEGYNPSPITAESFAQMVMSADKAQALATEEKVEIETASDAIETTAMGAVGMEKDQGMMKRAVGIGSTLLDLASNPQKAVIETGGKLLVGSVVGGATESSENGLFAAGLVGTALAVSSGGVLAIPAAYSGIKDISDHIDRKAELRLQNKLEEVNDRTTRVGLEAKFSMQLEAREKRIGASEQDRKFDHDLMLEKATEGYKIGFMPGFVQDRIKLEEMVREAGGETEAWFDQYEEFKTKFDAENELGTPDSADFLGKAKDMQNQEMGLASNTGFLRNLQSAQEKNDRLHLG